MTTAEVPLISIITICYNSAKTIRRTIQSVRQQQVKNLEYIFIDGGSKDETLEVINSENTGNFIVESGKDRGISHAFNKGIAKATGTYILLLNSDDYLVDNSLNNCLEYLRDRPKIDILCCNMLVARKGKIRTIESKPQYLNKGMSVAHPATIVKGQVYQQVGLFSEQFKIAMDYEFLLRCQQQNVCFETYNCNLSFMEETGVSAQSFFSGKKEVHQIRNSYNFLQPPLRVFLLENGIKHYTGMFLSSILPDSIYSQLRSFSYLFKR
jgi:glycosyltransferase involved in cell wall biosynthesis